RNFRRRVIMGVQNTDQSAKPLQVAWLRVSRAWSLLAEPSLQQGWNQLSRRETGYTRHLAPPTSRPHPRQAARQTLQSAERPGKTIHDRLGKILEESAFAGTDEDFDGHSGRRVETRDTAYLGLVNLDASYEYVAAVAVEAGVEAG